MFVNQIEHGHVPGTQTNHNNRKFSRAGPVSTLNSVDVDEGSDDSGKRVE